MTVVSTVWKQVDKANRKKTKFCTQAWLVIDGSLDLIKGIFDGLAVSEMREINAQPNKMTPQYFSTATVCDRQSYHAADSGRLLRYSGQLDKM